MSQGFLQFLKAGNLVYFTGKHFDFVHIDLEIASPVD